MKVVYIEKKIIILFFTLPNKFLALILLTPLKRILKLPLNQTQTPNLERGWGWTESKTITTHRTTMEKRGRKKMKRFGQHRRVHFTNCYHPCKRNLKIVVSMSLHNNHVHSNFMKRNPSFCEFCGSIYLPEWKGGLQVWASFLLRVR